MTLAPLYYLPGICKVNSDYAAASQSGGVDGRAARGRYRDGDGIRFVSGFPEKIGGFATATSSTTSGAPRGIKAWRDNSQVIRLAIGTSKKLYYYGLNQLVDITPPRGILSGTLTNPLTTNATTTVSVAHTSHGLQTGDFVQLVTGTTVDGIKPTGLFNPITVTDVNNYTLVNTSAATGSTSGGGGTVTYTYYRVTLSSPFSTVSGSSTVTVAHTNNGASVGDTVTISGASAVAGLTLSGAYVVQTAATNSYTIDAGSNANATTSGGGSPNFIYDISIGLADSSEANGYGTGGYGGNGYGTTGTTTILLTARTWCIDNYGQQILANPSGGTIYVWDPTIAGRAYPLYGAPSAVLAMFVTAERFVTALGISGVAMQMAWPDQNDYTAWTSLPTNTANSGRTLQGGNFLVGGIKIRDQANLLSSDTSIFSHTYTGDNFVYSTNTSADRCGFAGPLAVTVAGGVAYWMGKSDFWMWDGDVKVMPSDDIRDYVFSTAGGNPGINLTQAAKFVAGANVAKREIIFFYVNAASTEISNYVIYDIDDQCWTPGTVFKRTSWIDRDLFSYPMATDSSGNIYNHESGNDANGSALDAYIIAAPIDIANGENSMDIMSIEIDVERQTGNASLSVLTRIYPNDTDTVDGPYTVQPSSGTPKIDTRSNGKMAGFKFESNVLGGDFRLGVFRADISKSGARR